MDARDRLMTSYLADSGDDAMRFVLDSGRVGNTRLISAANFRELVAPQMRAPMDEYPALALSSPHFFSYALGWFVHDYHGKTV